MVSLTDLAQLPLIVPSRPNAFRLLIDTEMQRVNCKPNIVLEIDGLNAILELVKEGMIKVSQDEPYQPIYVRLAYTPV